MAGVSCGAACPPAPLVGPGGTAADCGAPDCPAPCAQTSGDCGAIMNSTSKNRHAGNWVRLEAQLRNRIISSLMSSEWKNGHPVCARARAPRTGPVNPPNKKRCREQSQAEPPAIQAMSRPPRAGMLEIPLAIPLDWEFTSRLGQDQSTGKTHSHVPKVRRTSRQFHVPLPKEPKR